MRGDASFDFYRGKTGLDTMSKQLVRKLCEMCYEIFGLRFYSARFRRAADLGCQSQIEIHPSDFTEVDEVRIRSDGG